MIERKVLAASFVRHEPAKKDLVENPGHTGRKLVLFLLLIATIAIALWVRHSQRTHLKEMVLHHQLWQLRSAVMIYHAKHSMLPDDLTVLMKAAYVDPVSGKEIRLVESIAADEEGHPISPLGDRYLYDPVTGTVRSQAACCRDW